MVFYPQRSLDELLQLANHSGEHGTTNFGWRGLTCACGAQSPRTPNERLSTPTHETVGAKWLRDHLLEEYSARLVANGQLNEAGAARFRELVPTDDQGLTVLLDSLVAQEEFAGERVVDGVWPRNDDTSDAERLGAPF